LDINTLYNTLIGNVEVVKSFNTTNITTMGVSDIERELLVRPTYEARVPDDYPNGPVEETGFRTLHRSVEASYGEHSLRVGTLDLHIRDKKIEQNEISLILMYIGHNNKVEIPGFEGGVSLSRAAMVNTLENGVISTCLLIQPGIAVIGSWFPEGMQEYGGNPYAQNPDEFKMLMIKTLEPAGVQWIPELNVLSDLYFLAKDIFEQARPS